MAQVSARSSILHSLYFRGRLFCSFPNCSKASCFKQLDILLALQILGGFTLGGLEICSPRANISLTFLTISVLLD